MRKPEQPDRSVNRLILDKLESLPPEVRELALKAVQLCEEYPDPTVVEMLHGVVRDLARQRGDRLGHDT